MSKEEIEDMIREIVREEIEEHCNLWHYYRGYEE